MDIANMSIIELENAMVKNKNNYLKHELIKRVLEKKYEIEIYNKKKQKKEMENKFVDNLLNECKNKKPVKKKKKESKFTRDDMNNNIAARLGSELIVSQTIGNSKKNIIQPFSKNDISNNDLYSKF